MEKLNQTRSLLSEICDAAKQKFLPKDAVQALEALDRTLKSQMAEISLAWMNVFMLFRLPINAMISWLFFRRAGLNFTEHIVANGFIPGLQNPGTVFTVLIVHSGMMDLGTVTLFYILLSFLFQFMAWKQVFAIQGLVRYFIGLFAIVLSVIGHVFVQGIAITVIYRLAA
jgi:hypothetical protein